MLAQLKAIERDFGRRARPALGRARARSRHRRCGAAAVAAHAGLTIPHPQLAQRDFVLQPLAAIAPSWRVRGALTAAISPTALPAARRAANRAHAQVGP